MKPNDIPQFFSHYERWEDWRNGLYSADHPEPEVVTESSRRLLSDPETFGLIAERMVSDWITAAEVNLTNRGVNRRAWVGQASCCYAHGAPDWATKEAWMSMTDESRRVANQVAAAVIEGWERDYIERMDECRKRDLGWMF